MSDAATQIDQNESLGSSFSRATGITMDGFYRSAINGIGFPVDAATWGINQIGARFDATPIENPIGGSEHLTEWYESYADNIAPDLNAEPVNGFEEGLDYTGGLAGDVAGVLIPGKAAMSLKTMVNPRTTTEAITQTQRATHPAVARILEKGDDMWKKLFETGSRFVTSEAGGMALGGLGKKAMDVYKWPFTQTPKLFGYKKPTGTMFEKEIGGVKTMVPETSWKLGKRSFLTGGALATDGLLNEFNGTAEILKGAVIWPVHAFNYGTSAIGSFLRGNSSTSDNAQFEKETGTEPDAIITKSNANPEGLERLSALKENIMSEFSDKGIIAGTQYTLNAIPDTIFAMGSDVLQGATIDGIGGMAKGGFNKATEFVKEITDWSPEVTNTVVGLGAFWAIRKSMGVMAGMTGLSKLPFAGLMMTVGAAYFAIQLATGAGEDNTNTAKATQATPQTQMAHEI